MDKPIRRHKTLQPLSREHHNSLLLCWKIRTGFRKKIEVGRIKCYVDWFFIEHVQPHFEQEEKYVFPILGMQHELVKQAMTHHRRLTRLFNSLEEIEKVLGQIEEELEQHIRFEERILFNEIQQIATLEQITLVESHHNEHKFHENTKDEFWK